MAATESSTETAVQSANNAFPAFDAETSAVDGAPQLGPEQRVTVGGTDLQVMAYSVPALADWNADGLPDLVVGEKFDLASGKVRVYLNSGSAGAPVYGAFFYVQAAGSDLTVPASGCLGAYPRIYDWNQDGRVDVFDEFIEIKNHGPVDINLSGWQLDDEANLGSSPFTLPNINLKPGERKAFYASETNILLSDGGDTVRLLHPNGTIYDAYTYALARSEDKSICRLPDADVFGSWEEDCTPTPNLVNTRHGSVPSARGGAESPVCDLPDTIPADFLFAECRGYGANVWNPFYWDQYGWQGRKFIQENLGKWKSFIE